MKSLVKKLSRSSDIQVLDVRFRQVTDERVVFRVPGLTKTRRSRPPKEMMFLLNVLVLKRKVGPDSDWYMESHDQENIESKKDWEKQIKYALFAAPHANTGFSPIYGRQVRGLE